MVEYWIGHCDDRNFSGCANFCWRCVMTNHLTTKDAKDPDIFNHKLRGLRALRGDSWTRFVAGLLFSVLFSACASVRGPLDTRPATVVPLR